MNEQEIQTENEGGEKEQKELQRNPAPLVSCSNTPQPTKPTKPKIAWWKVVTAVSLGIICFLLGCLTFWLSLDDELRTLMALKKHIQADYYQEVSDDDFYEAVFGGINDGLLDSYSQYMTPAEYAEVVRDLRGEHSGVGMVFSPSVSGLRVLRVCGNSPADAAGVQAGDTLIGCGKSVEQVQECPSYEAFVAFLDGYETNEEFFVQFQSVGGEKTVALTKQNYVENYVFYRTKEKSYAFKGENAEVLTETGAGASYLPADTAYIRLIQFTGNAVSGFDAVMEQFRKDGKKNLVLDLRGNGGGYLDMMQAIGGYFCKTATEDRPIVAVADFGERIEKYAARRNDYAKFFAADSRICVLADENSASASECLMGCMKDYGAIDYADICLIERNGVAKTFGKGIMQETYFVDVFKQDALKLTTAEIRWPKSNHSIHGRGILLADGTLSVAENLDFEEETRAAIEALFAN